LLSRFGVESRLRNATASLWVLGILLVEGVVEIVSVVEGGRPLPRHHHQHLKSAMEVQFCHRSHNGGSAARLPACPQRSEGCGVEESQSLSTVGRAYITYNRPVNCPELPRSLLILCPVALLAS